MNTMPKQTSNTAVLSLVFGILAWIALPFIAAIIAIVTGHIARGEIRRAPQSLDGDGMAVAGLVLGWANLFAMVLALLLFLFVFGGVAWLAWLAN